MQHVARLPQLPSARTMVAPIVALAVGAAAATGAYALIDNGESSTPAAKEVIVVGSPEPGAANIPGKDEAATAAGISSSTGVDLRGSNASTSSGAETSSESAETARRTDPHGVASQLGTR